MIFTDRFGDPTGFGRGGLWQDLQGAVRLTVISGSMDLTGLRCTAATGPLDFNYYQSFVAVPEPGSVGLLICGCALMWCMARWRRNKRHPNRNVANSKGSFERRAPCFTFIASHIVQPASHVMSSLALKFIAGGVVGVIAFYVVTVGVASAVSRHMEDGRLQWMRSSSLPSTVMEFYEWPARRVAVLPPMRWLFELSAAFWCGITDAPETTA